MQLALDFDWLMIAVLRTTISAQVFRFSSSMFRVWILATFDMVTMDELYVFQRLNEKMRQDSGHHAAELNGSHVYLSPLRYTCLSAGLTAGAEEQYIMATTSSHFSPSSLCFAEQRVSFVTHNLSEIALGSSERHGRLRIRLRSQVWLQPQRLCSQDDSPGNHRLNSQADCHPLGLVSEALHNQKEKKKRSESQPDVLSTAGPKVPAPDEKPQDKEKPSAAGDNGDDPSPVYVKVSNDQANELIATRQAVPADGEPATHELIPEKTEDDGVERDEADWALDEVTSDTEDRADSDENKIQRHHSTLAKGKVDISKYKEPDHKLPFPIILPQRRPGTKARGFVRAYAPALEIPGIDQDMFLGFLKEFHKAAQASPIFDVIMIATAITGTYPDIMVGLAVQAVQIAAAIGQEI